MSIVWMIVLGLIVGWVAKMLVPGTGHLGWVSTGLLGIAGGWVGGTLGSLVFAPHQFDITPPVQHSFLGALVGAVILLLVYRSVSGRGSRV
ncbi:MAG: GlsB/YeaQ/YmgE family stress response membrane protein [Mycobacteriaceae bacterium]